MAAVLPVQRAEAARTVSTPTIMYLLCEFGTRRYALRRSFVPCRSCAGAREYRLSAIRTHCASLVGRQPPISYIYRGGVTTLRTREWSLISSPSRHGVHRMHGLDGAAGHRIETCRLCACTAQPLLRPKQLLGPPLASWTLTPFFQAVFATLSMMAAAITVRIHWRCAHVVQTCLGDHHRLLESSPPAHGRRLRRGCRALSPSASQWQLP